MLTKGESKNNNYWYDLPERLIAQAPATPRDSSKLLVYNTEKNTIIIDEFKNLATHLPPLSILTLNDAKVVPARVSMRKESGGKIVVLFLVNEWISTQKGPIPCFLDRRGRVGEKLFFDDGSFCTIQKQEEQVFFLGWDGKAEDLLKNLDNYGTMPIPPYIKHSPLSRDELLEKYQTVFARSPGSSAAPTASLHFTPEVFARLNEAGIKKQYITLHVGLGTFAPLTEENIRTKTLHHEAYEVSQEVIHIIRTKNEEQQRRTQNLERGTVQSSTFYVPPYVPDITAVGTTVVRTLESVAISLNQLKSASVLRSSFQVQKNTFTAETDLFISPPFQFKVVDHLITNFHLPGSSLMMLVDAFLEHKRAQKRILELYAFAIQNNFRFFSFGDAMLIL